MMDGGRDLGVTRGVGPVLGLWIQKVSEMERHQFEQCFNLTDLLGLLGLNFPFVCNFLLYTLHLMDFLEVAEYLLANAASFVRDIAGEAKHPRVSWEVGTLFSSFMQLKLDLLSLYFLLTSFNIL